MSSFKSTDVPYSRLCQEADEVHEFINLEELNPSQLNELDVLNQSSAYDLQNHSLISHNSAQKDSDYHGHCNQMMYQTIPQQAQYEHQLQTDETILNQPYSPLNQNHYHYTRNYEQNTDPELHLYHPQVYPQQQMQNQFYYHINSLNNFNDNLNRFAGGFYLFFVNLKKKIKRKLKNPKKLEIKMCEPKIFIAIQDMDLIVGNSVLFFFICDNSDATYYTVLGNGTSYSLPTSSEAPPSEIHSTQSALPSSTLSTSYVSNPRKRKAYSTT